MQPRNNVSVSGRYRFTRYRRLPLPAFVRRWLFRHGLLEWARIGTAGWIKNTVTAASGHGLNIIARRLVNDTTYDLVITEAKIGTGTTAATTSDTDLETPVVDSITVANQSAGGGTATLEFFLTDAELPDGSYTEFGIFAGTQLFARSVISTAYDKSTNEDTAVEYEIAFVNA
ncbi:MAG: hypothetical protein RLO51_11185 [Thalassobaculum sp.]|uniref:hypothetical protein n=1 Tax=Thalassobaculum sp. TaxID=2022740 RepID=UPI0032EF8EC5